MGIYRKQIEIVGDILYAAEELTIDQNGASITRLIQKANISHSRISKILTNLVSHGQFSGFADLSGNALPSAAGNLATGSLGSRICRHLIDTSAHVDFDWIGIDSTEIKSAGGSQKYLRSRELGPDYISKIFNLIS